MKQTRYVADWTMRAAEHPTAGRRLRRARLGLAGLGRIGLLHATNLTERVNAAELVRVVDADESLARTVGERIGVEWGRSYENLVADPEVDAVVIATPTPLHVDMIERAAAVGKHVFCEKPISLDLASTLRAVAAAREAGIALQVGFHRRFDPDWAAAAERIRAGDLGDVYLFRTTLRDKQPPPFDYIRDSGGIFVDVTIHDLDIARWLVGEIVEVTAFGAALSSPEFTDLGDVDNAVVALRFADGALGVIDESRAAGYGYECSTEIVGSRATVRIGNHRRTHDVWLTPGSAAVDWVDDFTERFPDAYALELESFATTLLEGAPPTVTGEDAIAAFVLAQACERSWREGRTIQLRHEKLLGGVSYEAA